MRDKPCFSAKWIAKTTQLIINSLRRLDEHPTSPGHVLVVPKQHIPDLLCLPPELGAFMLSLVKEVHGKLSRYAFKRLL